MAERKMQLEDWLDDLCVRFIINLPEEDLSSVARICFQVEEAQWFYEDFIRPLDPTLPSMTLRTFCLCIFQHCPLLASFSVDRHMDAFNEFMEYKTRVPVRGAILLNEAMDSAVLVKGWKKGSKWSFPRGKINKDEDDLECAIREVNEETGFDIRAAGLVPKDEEVKSIEVTSREQKIRLYVFRNVPMDTVFQPRTRKEISKIEWFKLSELPAFRKKGNNQQEDPTNANKFYVVAPFLVELKKWVSQQKKKDAARAASLSHFPTHALPEEPLTEEDAGTQTDATAGPPTSTPAIETLEGATLELQRLLRVQPPTQGLQLSAAESGGAGLDKGEALMAMLHSKNPGARQGISGADSLVPHTPLDHIQHSIPEPHSPHHHHPTQRLPQSHYQQPPPNFPIVQHANQNVHPGYNNQAPVLSHAHPGYHSHAQAYMRSGPQVAPVRQPQKEPVLVHPQPLPPQVQQSLLTRGILPTPQLQEMAGMGSGSGAGGSGSFNKLPGNFNQGRGHVQQWPVNMQPPQMTSHTMSLLNAFKSSSTTRNDTQQQAPVSNGHAQGPGMANVAARHQYQQGQAPAPAPVQSQITSQSPGHTLGQVQPQWTSAAQAAGQPYGLQNMPPIPGMPNLYQQLDGTAGSTAQDDPRAVRRPQFAQPDAHRSNLLDMFKKQGPLSPTSSSDATARPGKPGNERASRAADVSQATAQPSSADNVHVPHQQNGAPVVMNPDLSLPFRPVQILSRPKQAENTPSPQAPAPPEHRDNRSIPAPLNASPATQPVPVPQTSNAPGFAQSFNVPYNQRQYAGATALPNTTSFPAAPMLLNRQETNPEQRQKLLSLFSKAQPSPTSLPPEEKSKMKEDAVDQSRARVASLSGGEGTQAVPSTSRRGSGTPISPSDRDFLLSYLDAVSKQAV